jgi:hypothetical protein
MTTELVYAEFDKCSFEGACVFGFEIEAVIWEWRVKSLCVERVCVTKERKEGVWA